MEQSSGWSPEPEPPGRETIGELIARVVADARAYASAETKRQKLRAAYIGACARDIAIAAIVALILLGGALVTLLIGLVWALTSSLGPWGALAAVIGGVVVIVVALGLFAVSRARRIAKRMRP